MMTVPLSRVDMIGAEDGVAERFPAENRFGFFLLLLLTPVVLIHPEEVWPVLGAAPLFKLLAAACLVVSLPRVTAQFAASSLVSRPITVCVLGVFGAVVLSHLSHFSLWGARTSAAEYFKCVILFLLLAGLVDSPSRLRRLLLWIVGCAIFLTTIALLNHYGVIQIAAITSSLDPDKGADELSRLRATGVYNDPNDFCLILLVASGICGYFATGWRRSPRRLLWFLPIAFFGFAFSMTRSRGGLMALIAGTVVFLVERVGWRKAMLWALLLGPLVFFIFSGRQTEVSTDQETAQTRMALWREGLAQFRESPVFGIGFGEFADREGIVVHNSYLQCFTELGFLGGVLFLGAFVHAMLSLHRLGRPALAANAAADVVPHEKMQMLRLRPYLAGILAAYAIGMFSLSRAYVTPTYLVLGVCAVYLRIVDHRAQLTGRFDVRFVRGMAMAGVLLVAVVYVFVHLFANQVPG